MARFLLYPRQSRDDGNRDRQNRIVLPVAPLGVMAGRWIVIPARLKGAGHDKLDPATSTERVLFPGPGGLSRRLTHSYRPAR